MLAKLGRGADSEVVLDGNLAVKRGKEMGTRGKDVSGW